MTTKRGPHDDEHRRSGRGGGPELRKSFFSREQPLTFAWIYSNAGRETGTVPKGLFPVNDRSDHSRTRCDSMVFGILSTVCWWGENRPQENACGGAKRRGASDDDRREEGFPRHPPSGFGAGGQEPKKGFFLGPGRKK